MVKLDKLMSETTKTDQTKIDKDVDTSVLDIPKYGYNKQFENKLLRFVDRGEFWSVPTDMEKQNLDKTKLNEDGKLQRWWGKFDKSYTVKKSDGEEIKVDGLFLTKTQNDRLTNLGNKDQTINDMFKDGCCFMMQAT